MGGSYDADVAAYCLVIGGQRGAHGGARARYSDLAWPAVGRHWCGPGVGRRSKG